AQTSGVATTTRICLVVDPYGNVVSKADDQEQLIIADIDLTQTAAARKQRPFLELRRPEWYD
ncbi:hypothetical protein DXD41_06710, partial [Bifidobacterium longum]|uniref:hypothetical protein n=1 Tax=Bifidobacterium longum TaxID=216816 RepID=UPI000E4E64A5